MDSKQLLQLLASAHPRPFTAEGPELENEAYVQNAPYAVQGPWRTSLHPQLEQLFRQWVRTARVPFDPDARQSDYDMRGFFKAMVSGQQPVWLGGHFPDTFKTPRDTTFSGESQYINPQNPPPFSWNGDNLVDTSSGRLIFRGK